MPAKSKKVRQSGRADHPRSAPDAGGATISVKVQPRASRTEIVGWRAEILIVRLCEPALEGRANEALRALLAEGLGIPKTRVILRSGATHRNKVVFLAGITQAAAEALGRP